MTDQKESRQSAVNTKAASKETNAIIVSNAEFLESVYGPLRGDERYWVTAFAGNPQKPPGGAWSGSAVTTAPDYSDRNVYASTAILKPCDGIYKKCKKNFSRLRLVVLDDAGVDDCSYAMETSKGNFQTGFILAEDITDEGVATRLQTALGKQQLYKADKSGYSAVRYVRLPRAINGKSEPAWPCRITEWNPDVRYTLEDFCKRFKLDYAAIVKTPKESKKPTDFDAEGREDDAELIRQIVTAESFHEPLLSLTARYIKSGMAIKQVVEIVQGLMRTADDGSDRWKSRMADIPRLVKGAAEKFTPVDVDGLPLGSEQALADELARSARGVLRWSPGFDWMVNRGTHWERDELLRRYNEAKRVCRTATKGAGKLATKICAASTANAILNLARCAPGIVTAVAAWDCRPMLLNTPNGTYDLETGKEVAREGLLFTQATRIAPANTPTPLWDKFMLEVFNGDLEMVEFMQRMAGYCLTGSTKEQKLFFLYGMGANGKSVFMDVLRAVGGKYSHNLPSEALMTTRHERHPTTFAALHGKRLAISSEIEESAHWAESRIKSLTGDETITARFMQQDEFTFTITHKHVIAGNFKPRLKGDDPAVVRRMVLVPFEQTFTGTRRDNNLPEKLKAEYGGILAWAIDGARKWAASGLAIPESVARASDEYMAENSDIDLWIAERCVRAATATTSVSLLYNDFSAWKKSNGEIPPSVKSFSQRLERKHKKTLTRKCAMFAGLRLPEPLEDAGDADSTAAT